MRLKRSLSGIVLLGTIASIGATAPADAVASRVTSSTVLVVQETPRPDGCVDRRSIVIDAADLSAATIDLPAGTFVSTWVYEQVRCGALFGIGQFTLASYLNPVAGREVGFTGAGASIDAVVPATVLVDGVEQPTTVHIDVDVLDRSPADPRVNGTWAGSATGTITDASGNVLVDLTGTVWTGADSALDEFAAATVQRSNSRRVLGPPPIFWSDAWRKTAVGMSSGQCRDASGGLVGTWEVSAWRTGSELGGVYARVDESCSFGIEFVVTTFGATLPDGTYADADAVTFVAVPGTDLFLGPDDVNALGVGDALFETFGMLEHTGDACTGATSPVDFVIGSSGAVTAC